MFIAVDMKQPMIAAGNRFDRWPAVAMGVDADGFALWRWLHAATCAGGLGNMVSEGLSTFGRAPKL